MRAQAASAGWFAKEEGLRREVAALEERVRALQDEKADLAAAASDSTRPLVRRAAWTPVHRVCVGTLQHIVRQ